MSRRVDRLVLSLVDDKDLVFSFFAVFSRFEYALKRGEFLANKEVAEADWNAYAKALRGRFETVSAAGFQDAIAFLRQAPPQKQVVENGELTWRDSAHGNGEALEAYVLRLVCTVRNNLFHGGKFPYPVATVPDVGRNRRLLESALTVLEGCLSLSPAVREKFEEAA